MRLSACIAQTRPPLGSENLHCSRDSHIPIYVFSSPSLALSSQDPSQGLLSADTFVFNGDNWATPQLMVVTGIDDGTSNTAQLYDIDILVATNGSGSDSAYDGLDVFPIDVLNNYQSVIVVAQLATVAEFLSGPTGTWVWVGIAIAILLIIILVIVIVVGRERHRRQIEEERRKAAKVSACVVWLCRWCECARVRACVGDQCRRMRAFGCVCMYACVCVRVHACLCKRACASVRVHACVCMRACACVRVGGVAAMQSAPVHVAGPGHESTVVAPVPLIVD